MHWLALAFFSLAAAQALAGFDPYETKRTVLDTVPGMESAVSVEAVAGNQLAILGEVQSNDIRVRLYFLNRANDLVFSRPLTLGLPGDEFAGTIAPADRSHFLATYVVRSGSQYQTVVALVRTDGNLEWQTPLPALGNTIEFRLPPRAALSPGGLVVVAYHAGGQTHVARLDLNGNLLGETIWMGDDGSGSAPFGLSVENGAIWLGVQNGLGLVSRYGLVKLDLEGHFLWAKSQTQDVINILGPAWIRGLQDGTAVIVAGEEGPFGSHRTTVTWYASDGTVLNRRMDPPAEINGGGILFSASILPTGYLAYSMILGNAPVLKLGRADGSVAWANDLSGQLGSSGSAFPATVDLDGATLMSAVSHDSLGFSTFTKSGAMTANETFPFSGENVRSLWTTPGTVVTVINGGSAISVVSPSSSAAGTVPVPPGVARPEVRAR